MYLTFIIGIADQYDLDIASAKHFNLIDLLFWRYCRHVNHTFDIQILAGECDTLRMVAGAGAYYSTLALFFVKALNEIISATDLIRANHLKVFALKIDFGVKFLRQLTMILQRCLKDNRF